MEKVHKPTGWKSLQMNVNDFWIFTISAWLFLWCVVCGGVSFVVVFGFPSPHHPPPPPRPHNSVCQRSIWKGTCHYLLHSIGFFTKNKCHRNMPFLWTLSLSTSCCFPIKSGGFYFSKSSACLLSVRCTIFSTSPYHLLAKSTVAIVKTVLKMKVKITCSLYCILLFPFLLFISCYIFLSMPAHRLLFNVSNKLYGLLILKTE